MSDSLHAAARKVWKELIEYNTSDSSEKYDFDPITAEHPLHIAVVVLQGEWQQRHSLELCRLSRLDDRNDSENGKSIEVCVDACEKWLEDNLQAGVAEESDSGQSHGAGHPESEREAPEKENRRHRRARWLAEAMLLVRDHPDWPDAQIARKAGIHPSQLTEDRCPEYQAAAAMARSGELRRGHVQNEPHSRQRTVEAYDYNSDPAKMDFDDE